MAYAKLGPFVDGGAPYLSAATFNALDQGAWDGYYGTGFLTLDSQYQTADGNDWALTLTRALTVAVAAGRAVLLTRMYPVASNVAVPSGAAIVGLGSKTGLQAPTNTGIVVLKGTSVSNVLLDNFTVDGNCLTLANTSKSYSRTVQFVGCTNVAVTRLTTLYNPDWAVSFEQCTNVLVTDYIHRAGAAADYGGRDGIHFLDCSDVLLDGARIHSGDDCVGITSQTQNIARITVRNVTGVSESAAVITLGNESTSAFTASDITIENISTYTSPDYAGISNYGVKLRAQNTALTQRVRISDVTVSTRNYGVWLDGNGTYPMTDVVIANVISTSSNSHGIYLHALQQFIGTALRGQSTTGSFDGLNLLSCSYGALTGRTVGCSQWGLQLNNCTSVDITAFIARENGAGTFASNTGGNGLLNSCTDVFVNGGQFVGAVTTSYYGLRVAAAVSGVVVSANTRTGGAH